MIPYNHEEQSRDTMEYCIICHRIKVKLPKQANINYKYNFLNYEGYVHPCYNTTLNIPVFGKRASMGQQHLQLFEEESTIWEKPFRVQMSCPVKPPKKGVLCNICRDEILYFSNDIVKVN
ncbi:hypothetical protein EBU71_21645 [bacterium]|nr:hypothetical protein [Candidatus Elulimicrobium humile]